MLPTHLLLFLLPYFTLAQDTTFIEPQVTPTAEFYTQGDTRYSIHLQPVSWFEANKLCLADKARLLEMTSAAVALYIGEALAESQANTLGIWVGAKAKPVSAARRTRGGELVWSWQSSDRPIATPLDTSQFPMNAAPFWGSQPPLEDDAINDYCLLTARRTHHSPLIAADLCSTLRPFICEKSNIEPSATECVQERGSLVIGTKEFFLFHAAFTWGQALSHCRSFGMRLASVVHMKQADALKHRMLRARPVMENAWIGGMFMVDRWKWVSTNEEISTASGVEEGSDRSKLLVSWYRPKRIMKDGCLLADRHVCEHFTYVEANCERKRNFICELEKRRPPGVVVEAPPLQGVYVGTAKRTWFKALQICAHCVQGFLYQPKQDRPAVLYELYHSMVHILPEQVRHVWIGGYLYRKDVDSRFKWVEKVPESNEALGALPSDIDGKSYNFGRHENGSLTMCALDVDQFAFLLDYHCLNLDRENDRDFFMYGVLCDYKQYFICTGPGPLKPECSDPWWDEEIKGSEGSSNNR